MNSRTQSFIIYFLLIVAIGAMLYVGFRQDNNTPPPLTINQVAQSIQNGDVARVIIQSDTQIHIVYKSGKEADSKQRIKRYLGGSISQPRSNHRRTFAQ